MSFRLHGAGKALSAYLGEIQVDYMHKYHMVDNTAA